MSDVYCEALSKCCPMIDLPFDASSCARNALIAMQRAYATSASTVAYNAGAVQACLAAERHMLGACIWEAAASVSAAEACAAVFVGLLPTGSACQVAQECAPVNGARVDCRWTTANDGHGTCVVISETPAAPHAKLGEACLNTCMFDSCDAVTVSDTSTVSAYCYLQEGLFCGQQGVCQASVEDGAACGADQCKLVSYCSFFDSICEPKIPDGGSCNFNYECSSFSCWTMEETGARVPVCGPPLIPSVRLCAGSFD